MSFLNFNPAVYVIGEEYEICVSVEAFGLVTVKIGEQVFYEDHSGVLSTEKLYARIRVPQTVLDSAGAYTVLYRKTVERKSYWSTLGEEERAEYSFKALKKGKNLNIYHISDVHYCFESAKKVASYSSAQCSALTGRVNLPPLISIFASPIVSEVATMLMSKLPDLITRGAFVCQLSAVTLE